jgi:tetratricopeptide (TPR) repeat protein
MRTRCVATCLLAPLLLLTCPASYSEEIFSLSLSPGIELPVAAAIDGFSTGWSAGLTGLVRLSAESPLVLGGSARFAMHPTTIGTALSTVSLGPEAGIMVDLLPSLSARATIGAGYSLNLYEGIASHSLYARAGASVAWRLIPEVSLGIQASFSESFDRFEPMLSDIGVTLGATYHFGAARRQPRIEIRIIELLPIFPVFYKHYDTNPLGRVALKNLEKYPLQNIEVTFQVSSYMDKPKTCARVAFLKPGEEVEVGLFALLGEDRVMAVTSPTKAQATVALGFTARGSDARAEKVESVELLNRNAMTWEDDRRAAAFVSNLDPAVLRFSKAVASGVRAMQPQAVSDRFRLGAGLFSALSLYGMSYVVDPASSYAEFSAKKMTVDYLQFPRDTLEFKTGDCDDLSILYCALLESQDIPAAFVTVPGHIFAAFRMDLQAREAARLFERTDDFIEREDGLWVPVEVTMVGRDFLSAWREGARQWREFGGGPSAGFWPIREAWTSFERVGVPGDSPSAGLVQAEKARAAAEADVRNVLERYLTPQVARLQAELNKQAGSARLRNALGVLYGRFGLVDEAAREFRLATTRESPYAPALVNLASIAYSKRDFKDAADVYDQALRADPSSSGALLGLARVNFELENYGASKESLEQLRQFDPQLADRFAYLSGRSDQAARASSQAAREEKVWSDE